MANYRAVANGNWSNLATWEDNSTGTFIASTVLPGINDDVYSNDFQVQLDQDINIKTLNNINTTNVTRGGRFNISVNRTVTTSEGIFARQVVAPVMNSGQACVHVNTASISVTINSNVTVVATFAAGGYQGVGVCMDVSSTLTINGNLTGGNGVNCVALFVSSGGTVNITGDQYASTNTTAQAIRNIGSATYNITGNQYGSLAPAILSTATASFNVTGNQIAAAAEAFLNTALNSVLNFIGSCFGSASKAGISNTQESSTVNYTGSFFNVGKYQAINSPVLWFTPISNSSVWQFVQTDQITTGYLYAAGTVLGSPLETDVRSGVTYADGALTGSLAVPPSGSVALGVPVDDGVGTAMISITDMGALLASYIV
jgi:hypothetical protein